MSEEELRAKKEEVHHTQTHAIYAMVKRMVTPSNKTIRIKKYLFHTVLMCLVFSVTINFVQQEDAESRIARLQKQALKIKLLNKNNRKVIWFDRKREHPSKSFAQVDEKFPAGYEVWDGSKLIERWHWRIENDPRTHQFGDMILRCVAKYSDDGAYIGYTEYQMVDYPTESHEEFESLRKPDAIVFHLSTKRGFVTLSKPTLKAKWKGKTYLGAEKISDGFPHSKNEVHASMLIENQTDLDYVEWLSERFKFIQNDVVNAYLAKKDFEEIIKNAPNETQAAWSNFVKQMNHNCEATQAYIENKWRNRKIEGTATLN